MLGGGGDAIFEAMRETDDDEGAGELMLGSEYEDGEVAEDEDATLLPP